MVVGLNDFACVLRIVIARFYLGPNHSGTVDNGSQPHFSGASSLPSNGREGIVYHSLV